MRNAPGQCRGKRDGSTYLQRFIKRVKIDLLVNVYKPQNRQLCIIVVVSKSCHCMVPRFMLFFLCFLPRYCWFLPLLFNLFCYIRTLFLMHLFFLPPWLFPPPFLVALLDLPQNSFWLARRESSLVVSKRWENRDQKPQVGMMKNATLGAANVWLISKDLLQKNRICSCFGLVRCTPCAFCSFRRVLCLVVKEKLPWTCIVMV